MKRDFRLGQTLARRRLDERLAQVALGRLLAAGTGGPGRPHPGPAGELALATEHHSAVARAADAARARLVSAVRARAAHEILERRHLERLARHRRLREARELEEANAPRPAVR